MSSWFGGNSKQQVQAQAQMQVREQVQSHQLLLDSITNSYKLFDMYLESVAFGNADEKKKGNYLMVTGLNGLSGMLSFHRDDADDEGLLIAREFIDGKNKEMEQKFNLLISSEKFGRQFQNRQQAQQVVKELQDIAGSIEGAVNSMLDKEKNSKLDLFPVQNLTSEQFQGISTEKVFGGLIAEQNHGIPDRMKEVERNGGKYSNEHARLLESARQKQRAPKNQQAPRNKNYDMANLRKHMNGDLNYFDNVEAVTDGPNNYRPQHGDVTMDESGNPDLVTANDKNTIKLSWIPDRNKPNHTILVDFVRYVNPKELVIKAPGLGSVCVHENSIDDIHSLAPRFRWGFYNSH